MKTDFKWIFLDIDGVLAPDNRYENWEPTNNEELCRFEEPARSLLFDVLTEFCDLKIAISSSWKELFPIEKTKSLFPKHLLNRIYGYTPFLPDGEPVWIRRLEILQFLEDHNCSGEKWIAVDDLEHFSKKLFNDEAIIVKDAWIGFSKADQLRLINALKNGYSDLKL